MTLIAQHLEVFKLVIKDGSRTAFDVECGVGEGRAAQLQLYLFVVVAVNVTVATGPDEIAHRQIALLGHHVGQQRIAGNVEGHPQKNIGTALVKLAGQLSVGHIELKEGVAGHQSHF